MATRRTQLTSAILIAALVAPLVAAGAAAAQDPGCPGHSPPASSSDSAPCHGAPLLYCCDDVSTAADHNKPKLDKPPVLVDLVASVSACLGAGSAGCIHPAEQLTSRASPLRLSVVLRV